MRTRITKPADDVSAFLAQFRQGNTKMLNRSDLDKLTANKTDTALVKFFDPCGSWTWYASEAEIIRDEDGTIEDICFYGLVDGDARELGYFSFKELASSVKPAIRWMGANRLSLRMPIERDLYWKPTRLSEIH